MTESFYGPALAAIHDSDFTFVAEAAARTTMRLLPSSANRELILDIGCGSGVFTKRLCDAGYRVHGIDASPAMIELASQQAPLASFTVASIYEAELPAAHCAVAVGEVFNYTNARSPSDLFSDLLSKVRAAIDLGGFLLFDFASPGRAGLRSDPESVAGLGWTIRYRAEESGLLLTRHIDIEFDDARPPIHERHELRLLEVDTVQDALTEAGFKAELLPGYSNLEMPDGWNVVLARTQ